MPIIDDLEGPIEFVKFSGPAVYALEHRKEPGDLAEPDDREFLDNWHRMRGDIVRGLRTLIAAGDSAIAKLRRE